MHDNKTLELTDADKIDIVLSAWRIYIKELRNAEKLVGNAWGESQIKGSLLETLDKKYLAVILLTGAYSRFLDVLADLFGSSELLNVIEWNGNKEATLLGLVKLTEKTKGPKDGTVWLRYRNSPKYKRILTTALEGPDWSSEYKNNSAVLREQGAKKA